MSITTKITVTCSGATDGKPCDHTFVQEGDNVTKRSTKLAARKAGWYWRRKATQLCADHRPSAVAKGKTAKATTKASKKATIKAAPKKTPVVIARNKAGRSALPLAGKKPEASTPFVGGQSIGKLAKSAKKN